MSNKSKRPYFQVFKKFYLQSFDETFGDFFRRPTCLRVSNVCRQNAA